MISGAAGPLLRVAGLSVDYEDFVLAPVSFEIAGGDRVALVGPNGAGKSTIIKAIIGRIPVHHGIVEFDGAPITGREIEVRRRIGLLPETLPGYGWMRVHEHLQFLSNFYPAWDAGYARELVGRLGIPVKGKLATLSRGERVKLMFVAAEAYRPSLLLLDEPTSGLDPVVRTELLRCIDECVVSDSGRAVLFSTHILEDVERLSSRVLVLARGFLKADTTTEQLRRWNNGQPVAQALLNLLMDENDPATTRRADLG